MEQLEPYLTTVCHKSDVADTRISLNCHHVALDGSGQPRLIDLTEALSEWMVDYAIPRRALLAIENEPDHVRRRKTLALRKEAKNTFKKNGMSGEQGEMLMFVISEAILGLPQLLCKMDLKTDPEMHFHGLDGVHCGVGSNENLAVYWCESKVEKDVGDAMGNALDGLRPFLLSAGTGDKDKKRELALVNRYMDLGDESLQKMVLDALDPSKVEFNSIEWRGICFIGFDTDLYPDGPNEKSAETLNNEFKAEIKNWMKSLEVRSKNRKLESFDIHFIFVPFGFCEDFRKAMSAALEVNP